ncbi:pimeloyl-ACP methyl ester carboxylesterase [Allonocardiopsis opalescens]|uniref:Pimeloyl-ACP methyl ester carboxylesterase n=1 Tax=Allonocardiopsis opalescens TaxID=1144618 RepID=A0A2T0Q5B2_9ACTN|nr:pimeloyl-ACP methyl ester carboxylesterase [Allonocardiopsis opalescens]
MRDPDRLGTVRLPGGRTLGWAEWGPRDGRPVLFFSGAAMGRGLGFGGGAPARLGVRLIAVERPGIGASEPEPGRSLADWPGDVRGLAEGLGLGAFSIVGFSQGAPFVLACAAAGVCAAAAVVSGQDDLGSPALAGLLDPGVAGMIQAARADPAGFEAAVADDADAESMWRLVAAGSSPTDLAVYTEPAFAAAYRACLAEGFAQGPGGYARDLALCFGRWPMDLGAIGVPVDLWYGALDTSPVHSPDHGAALAARIPAARRHLLPDAGGSLLWTHSDRVLAALLERADEGQPAVPSP